MVQALLEKEIKIAIGFEENNIAEIYEGGVGSSICLESKASDEWRPLHKETDGKFHPVHFYSNHPQVGCAWVKVANGPILARAILWRDNPKGPWQEFGWPYFNDSFFGRILVNFLASKKIQSMSKTSNWESMPFKIKGFYIERANEWVCPIPYMDNLSPVYCRFNKETNEFEFIGKRRDGYYLVDGQSHKGYITGTNPRMVTPSRFGF